VKEGSVVADILRSRNSAVIAGLLLLLTLIPLVAPRFYVYIMAVILVNGLLAMSLNLLVGHGGAYQFHHGVFYGVGAYASGLILAKTGLPAWVGLCAGPLAAALTGLVIGAICVRLNKLYFGMLQISLGSLVWIVALRWYSLTNGDDGLHGIPLPDLLSGSVHAYYFLLAVVTACLGVMFLVLKSPFGATLRAVRDNPQRCEAVGIDVRRHQLIAIVIGTFFAGAAGVLFVVLEGSVFPDMLFWVLSLEIFIMCLLGGWFTFFGPMLGAAIMVSLRTFVGSYTDYWTLILGIVLILIIFFLPEGIMGVDLRARLRARERRSSRVAEG
jgi:branched-chain amino acid transport system permease protein